MIYLLFFQVFNRDEPDREKLVHVTVKASDKGRPQLEDVCTLSVKVKDKNDNKPIFDRGQYDEPVAQDTPVGTQIMRVSATDVDEGENQKISYDLSATRIPGLLIYLYPVANKIRQSVDTGEMIMPALGIMITTSMGREGSIRRGFGSLFLPR